MEILCALRDRLEAYHRVSIEDSALAATAAFADEQIPDRRL